MYVLVQVHHVEQSRVRVLPVFFASEEEANNHATFLNSVNAHRGTAYRFAVGEGGAESRPRAEQALPCSASRSEPRP